jgi:hypothetical protein
MLTVVVAGRDIPPYTILSGSDLNTVRVPDTEAVNSYGREGDLLGKMLTDEARGGNVIRRDSVVDLPTNWSDDMLIASFHVPTARIIGGQLRRGHYIDLMVTRPETQEQFPEARWLAGGLWVADVRQASGAEVLRPTAAPIQSDSDGAAQPTPRPGGLGGLGGFSSTNSLRSSQGPANLVVIAAHRETVLSIADYVGARLYDPWVVVLPGGGVASTVGRIDGIAFNDVNENHFQERNERGLDGIQITLSDDRGVPKKSLQTIGGGKLTFDQLEPGTYSVEMKTPEGYSSVSTEKLQINVVAGQNRHVIFALKKDLGPELEATPAAQAQEPTAADCRLALTISDRQDGRASTSSFAPDVSSVWAIAKRVNECAVDVPLKVAVYLEPEGKDSARIYQGMLRAGSDSVALEIKSDTGGAFTPGSYIGTLLVDEDDTLMDVVTWRVLAPVVKVEETAVTPAATPEPTPAVIEYPITGAETLPADALPPTRFGFGRGR